MIGIVRVIGCRLLICNSNPVISLYPNQPRKFFLIYDLRPFFDRIVREVILGSFGKNQQVLSANGRKTTLFDIHYPLSPDFSASPPPLPSESSGSSDGSFLSLSVPSKIPLMRSAFSFLTRAINSPSAFSMLRSKLTAS